jgi:hypothetical protein
MIVMIVGLTQIAIRKKRKRRRKKRKKKKRSRRRRVVMRKMTPLKIAMELKNRRKRV